MVRNHGEKLSIFLFINLLFIFMGFALGPLPMSKNPFVITDLILTASSICLWSNNNLMVSSILVYQYGVPAVLAPASIIPVLFWLAPAGSSDDRGQRGHRVEVTVDSG